MPQRLLADASIVVAWTRPEEIGQEVEAFNLLLTAHGRGQIDIRIPSFALLEIANPLIRKYHWEATKVTKILIKFHEIGLVDPALEEGSAIMSVPEIAERHRLSTYDAYYAAVAAKNNFTLVSIDSDLVDAGLAQLPSALNS